MKKYLFLAIMTALSLLYSCDNTPQSQKGAGSPKEGNKKVLILSSSPRKGGNSDLLCDKFMEGALSAGHDVEKVFLNDLTIRFLLTNDDYEDRTGVTPVDDAPEVVDKMIQADVIVMATPIYYYNMSGMMKTMIERTFEREKELEYKDFYFIMTSGDPERKAMDCAVLGFRNFLLATPTSKEKGIIYGTDVSNAGDVKDKPVMQEAYEMGRHI
ncbi:MAG: flavodoxin family protein [Oscillospiraceae bacterium]|nr:flavodoxin family protein [Oscillospiraceae bacterium]